MKRSGSKTFLWIGIISVFVLVGTLVFCLTAGRTIFEGVALRQVTSQASRLGFGFSAQSISPSLSGQITIRDFEFSLPLPDAHTVQRLSFKGSGEELMVEVDLKSFLLGSKKINQVSLFNTEMELQTAIGTYLSRISSISLRLDHSQSNLSVSGLGTLDRLELSDDSYPQNDESDRANWRDGPIGFAVTLTKDSSTPQNSWKATVTFDGPIAFGHLLGDVLNEEGMDVTLRALMVSKSADGGLSLSSNDIQVLAHGIDLSIPHLEVGPSPDRDTGDQSYSVVVTKPNLTIHPQGIEKVVRMAPKLMERVSGLRHVRENESDRTGGKEPQPQAEQASRVTQQLETLGEKPTFELPPLPANMASLWKWPLAVEGGRVRYRIADYPANPPDTASAVSSDTDQAIDAKRGKGKFRKAIVAGISNSSSTLAINELSACLQPNGRATVSGRVESPGFQSSMEVGFTLLEGREPELKRRGFSLDNVRLEGKNSTIYHPAISEEAIFVDSLVASLKAGYLILNQADNTLTAQANELNFEQGGAIMGLDLTAHLDRNDRTIKGNMAISIPQQGCNEIVETLSNTIAPRLGELEAKGEVEARINLDMHWGPQSTGPLGTSGDPDIAIKVQGGVRKCHPVSTGALKLERFEGAFRHSPAKVDPNAAGVVVGSRTDSFVPTKALPPYVIEAMVVTEDGAFRRHRGISPGLIARGIALNLSRNRYSYGGSTITQQLVKNLVLDRQKNLARKVEEAIMALALERYLTKDRILELYVNVIEFGPGIYGIQKAAEYYFDKPAAQLTPLEASFLAAIKPKPSDGPRLATREHIKGWWHHRLITTMDRLLDKGFISSHQHAAAFPYQPEFKGEVLDQKHLSQRPKRRPKAP